MKRVFIKLKDETTINIAADTIDHSGEWLRAWDNGDIVAYVAEREVMFCYITEQKSEGLFEK